MNISISMHFLLRITIVLLLPISEPLLFTFMLKSKLVISFQHVGSLLLCLVEMPLIILQHVLSAIQCWLFSIWLHQVALGANLLQFKRFCWGCDIFFLEAILVREVWCWSHLFVYAFQVASIDIIIPVVLQSCSLVLQLSNSAYLLSITTLIWPCEVYRLIKGLCPQLVSSFTHHILLCFLNKFLTFLLGSRNSKLNHLTILSHNIIIFEPVICIKR